MKKIRIDGVGALLLLAVAAMFAYVAVRAVLLLFSGYSPAEKTLAVFLIAAEFFVILHGIGYVVNIYRSLVKRKEPVKGLIKLKEEPSVAILVAARHEPKEVLRKTFLTLNAIKYRNKEVYFLDDSSDEKYLKEAEELAEDLDLKLFRRKERHGAKAGIVNDCLKSLKHKYVAIFDADQNPLPDFLSALIPIMEKDSKLAFVQTPQFYSNIEGSPVSRGAAFQQAVFYEYICEGKSTGGAMFCCGTNIVFRRQALMEVGGLDESTVTEDFATSVKIHSRGWSSLYYNHVYAFGMGPEALSAYFKQQFRWAAGTIAVFKKLILRLITRPFSLNLMQWWEYLLSSTYYLVGLAFFVLMICPVIYLFFRVPSFFAKPEVYFFVFLPYITLSMMIFYSILRKRNYKPGDLFLGQMLGFITFTVYMRAALSAILGVKITFGVTEKGKGRAISCFRLWPQCGFMFLNFIAIIWGLNRFVYELEPAIIVNSFWAFYHFFILSGVLYFNREQR